MLDIGWTEMLVIAVIAIVVVGPKDLPRLLRTVGGYVTRVKRVAGEFQKQMNDAVRESELDDIRKEVAQVNASGNRIAADMDKSMRLPNPPPQVLAPLPPPSQATAARAAAATAAPAAAIAAPAAAAVAAPAAIAAPEVTAEAGIAAPAVESPGIAAEVGAMEPVAAPVPSVPAPPPKPVGIMQYDTLSEVDRALIAYNDDDPYSGEFMSRIIEPPKPPPAPEPEPEVASAEEPAEGRPADQEASGEVELVERDADAETDDAAAGKAAAPQPAMAPVAPAVERRAV